MKFLDCVEVIVEKECYAKYGVHKVMQGVIWLEECIDGKWDVYFSQYGNKEVARYLLIEQCGVILAKLDKEERTVQVRKDNKS